MERKPPRRGAPFTALHIADINPRLVEAAANRLKREGALVVRYDGLAASTAEEVASNLDPHGLHLVFLDPYNLETLDFTIIETLARFKHIDIIVHINVSDQTRNLDRYVDLEHSALDSFAPRWREKVDCFRGRRVARRNVFEYWRSLVESTGLTVSDVVHEVKNRNSAPLYWLLLLSRHPLPEKLWSTTTGSKQGELFS